MDDLEISDAAGTETGGAGAGAGGSDDLLDGFELDTTVEDGETVEIPDLELADIIGKDVATGTEETEDATGEAGAGEAGVEASKERFVVLPGGAKVKVGEDGKVDDTAFQAALSDAYVPLGTFHRELQKAHALRKDPEAEEHPQQTETKEPEPFKRAGNPYSLDEDPASWYEHEREQDKLERAYERNLDTQRWQERQEREERERQERHEKEALAEHDKQFNQAVTELEIYPEDAAPRKAYRTLLGNIVAQDPRHPFAPKMEGISKMSIPALTKEYHDAIKGLVDHEVNLRLKALDKTTETTVASPHKGGAISVATQPRPTTNQDGRPQLSERKPGEKVFSAMLRDLKAGRRAPRR